MKAAFHTLGCKVNQYETEAIKEAFVSRGAEIVAEDEPADIYVINTCTVTNIADRKSRQFIRRAKRANPDALIVVTGCYVQVAAEEIEKMPEADIIIGNSLKTEIADRAFELYKKKQGEVIRAARSDETRAARSDETRAARSDETRAARSDETCAARDDATDSARDSETRGAQSDETCAARADETRSVRDKEASGSRRDTKYVNVLPRKDLTAYEDMGIVTSAESAMCRAYIKIEEGCDRFCSYCLIPYARGRVRSRAAAEVVEEAKVLVEKGFGEIVLTGINTALYGTEPGFSLEREEDEEGLSGLEIIIKRIDALEGDFRIRLSSLEPTVVDREDVMKLLGYKRLCHHLHLSVQSGSSKVLRAMNRRYTKDEYLEIVDALRDFDPLYGITTDVIVGFPGETEEDFADTLEVVKRSGYGKVHVFRYSPRRGTPGERMADAVPGGIKNERAERLEDLAEETARAFIEANLGIVQTILTEEYEDGYITGHTGNYIKTYIKADPEEAEPGRFVEAVLTEYFRDGALAEPKE